MRYPVLGQEEKMKENYLLDAVLINDLGMGVKGAAQTRIGRD